MVVMLKTSLRMTPSMKTSTEMAYEQMSAAQRYERNLSRPTAPPRNAPLEFEEYALTWSDKVALVPRMRPKWSDHPSAVSLHPDSRSPPNFARGSHDVQMKDSSLVPRVQEHDLLMRYMGHTNSSDRAPRARIDLW
mmetsp:Transcript_69416/g.137656  ORF Transcript_69416/g.137656 Transcript_69416/m.137656 type:complete len:136 (-) Transcript_69416:462-869(-)